MQNMELRRQSMGVPHRRHALLALLTAVVAPGARAHFEYVAMLPNGDGVNGVDAVGHIDPYGGGDTNAFGKAFSKQKNAWTKALCEADSDGDGLRNGFELGDPCCLWSVNGGQSPAFTNDVSSPGDATNVPASRKCSDVTCTNGVQPCIAAPSASSSPSASPSRGSLPSVSASTSISSSSTPAAVVGEALYPATEISIGGAVAVVALVGFGTIAYGRQLRRRRAFVADANALGYVPMDGEGR